jgi:hypothetical protein
LIVAGLSVVVVISCNRAFERHVSLQKQRSDLSAIGDDLLDLVRFADGASIFDLTSKLKNVGPLNFVAKNYKSLNQLKPNDCIVLFESLSDHELNAECPFLIQIVNADSHGIDVLVLFSTTRVDEYRLSHRRLSELLSTSDPVDAKVWIMQELSH